MSGGSRYIADVKHHLSSRSASVVCLDYNAFAEAWSRIREGFHVREGHGRLKNNLFAEMRPPDLLVNVVVEPPQYFPIIAEVQARCRCNNRLPEAQILPRPLTDPSA